MKPPTTVLDDLIINSSAVAARNNLTTNNGNSIIVGKDVIDKNKSAKVDDAPQYEDMETFRQSYYQSKNEFELKDNNAYCRAEDATNDGAYDN